MDDQIMNSSEATTNDEPTCYSEIDISNHTLLAEWIKGKLQELDSILVEGMSHKNSA
jgi:hypothetical protein